MIGTDSCSHRLEAESPLAPGFSSALLSEAWLQERSALVVTKVRPGFDRPSVTAIRELLGAVARGEWPDLKYLVFDFAHGASEANRAVDGLGDLAAANAELIMDTPVITLAWARGMMSGADFEFAMSCSSIVAEQGASFSLGGDPFSLLGVYAALGRKIGFVKAERLAERAALLNAAEMRDLLVVKDVVEPQPELVGIDAYLAQVARRYNASHAIFRAHRLAEPPIDRRALEEMVRSA